MLTLSLEKEEIERRLLVLVQILHEENIENIFKAIQTSLHRNDKLSKTDSRVQNKNQLFEKFLSNFANTLLRSLVEWYPPYSYTIPS